MWVGLRLILNWINIWKAAPAVAWGISAGLHDGLLLSHGDLNTIDLLPSLLTTIPSSIIRQGGTFCRRPEAHTSRVTWGEKNGGNSRRVAFNVSNNAASGVRRRQCYLNCLGAKTQNDPKWPTFKEFNIP